MPPDVQPRGAGARRGHRQPEAHRELAEDLFAYLAVNGVLWLFWLLTDPSCDGRPAVSRVGVDHLERPARDRRLEGVGSRLVGHNRPITEDEIEREMKRASGR